jgi:hypothetical protein
MTDIKKHAVYVRKDKTQRVRVLDEADNDGWHECKCLDAFSGYRVKIHRYNLQRHYDLEKV